ncbi:hypothetical protein P3T25_005515 [Paraburkholderia sp. GAS32]
MHARQAWTLESTCESSSRYPLTLDTSRDNFEPAHLFERDRRDYRAVNCETQVLRSTRVLGSREPPNVELVVFNVLTAVERLFADSGVRQGVQPGEIGDIACSRCWRS